MSKKYEFVPGDEITIAPGRTVKRIRALEEMNRESFSKAAQFVTTKPAKPAISIKE